MTSQVKATIIHNHPVTVVVREGDTCGTERMIYKTEGEAGKYHDSKSFELNEWFSGNQEIVIRETKSEVK